MKVRVGSLQNVHGQQGHTKPHVGDYNADPNHSTDLILILKLALTQNPNPANSIIVIDAWSGVTLSTLCPCMFFSDRACVKHGNIFWYVNNILFIASQSVIREVCNMSFGIFKCYVHLTNMCCLP